MSSAEQAALFEAQVIKQTRKRFHRLLEDTEELHSQLGALYSHERERAEALRAQMHENLAQLEALRDRLKRLNAWHGRR